MASIKDVAKRAGVSISTVSYALNGVRKVSPETRERIQKIAKEMNYQPNTAAQSFKSKKTNTIGLFLSDICSPYYLEILRGVQSKIIEKNYDLIVANIYQGEKSTAFTLLRDQRVDGGIILGSSVMLYQSIVEISKKNIPIVVTDQKPEVDEAANDYMCTLLVDNYDGACKAVEHLVSLGRRKIYYLGGKKDSYDNKIRFEGYLDTLKKNNIVYNDSYYLEGDFEDDVAYESIEKIINDNDIPDAIFAANDQMGLAAIRAFQEFDIEVPGQVAVVGFDDIYTSSLVHPSLTTIWRDERKMGETAVEMIFEMLEGRVEKHSVIMPTKLIVRESSGA